MTKITRLGNGDYFTLGEIIIPNTIQEFGKDAFDDVGINQVTYNGTLNEWINIKFNSAFSNPNIYSKYMMKYMENGKYVNMSEDFTTPSSLDTIGYQFVGCKFISLNVASSTQKILSQAFYHCESMRTIVIPTSVTTIEKDILQSCWGLLGVEIPFIGSDMYSANSLEYLFGKHNRIPNEFYNLKITNAQTLASSALKPAKNLKKVFISKTVISIGYYLCEDVYNVSFYCEAQSQPSGWRDTWNYSGHGERTVYWGCSKWAFSLQNLLS